MSETINETSIERIKQLSQAFEATPEQIDLIKRTICRGATDDELALFLYTSKRLGLDPLLRQIHAVKRWDSSLQKEVMAIQVGIDGYRLTAERTGKYMGSEEPIFEYFVEDAHYKKIPRKATVTVLKLGPQGMIIRVSASALWDEYVQKKKDGNPAVKWASMPHLMLSKCAEALALRKAFPNELSGTYTEEEMEQADPRPAIESKKANVLPVTAAPEKACVETEEPYETGKKAAAEPLKLISPAQQKNIQKLAESAKMAEGELVDLVAGFGYHDLAMIKIADFPNICKRIVESFQAKKAK